VKLTSNTVIEQRPRPLLVHDEFADSRALHDALQSQGLNLTVARGIAEAFASTRLDAPDHIVIDLDRPTFSGLALVQHLKMRNPKARIVMLAVSPPRRFTAKARRLGAIRCLAKPARIDAIMDAFRPRKKRNPKAR
jgi:two-component system response regulator RegA